MNKSHVLMKTPPVNSKSNNIKALLSTYSTKYVFLSLVSTITLLFCSCNKNENSISCEYVFYKDPFVTQAKMDSLALMNVTSLDTAHLAILPDNTCLSVADNNYFVYSRTSVYRFDAKGKCQAVIGRLGHGRGEYSEARDVAIDKKERKVIVLGEQSVYVYDYDGKFVSKHSIDIPANSICRTSSHYWFSTGNNTSYSTNALFRTNLEYRDMEGFAPAESEVNMIEKNFGKGEMPTYHNWFSHTVYRLDGGNASVAFRLSFPGLEIPECVNKNMDFWERNNILSSSNYISIAQCLENKQYPYLLLAENIPSTQSMQAYHWIINKETENSLVIKINQNSMESYHVNPQYLSEDNILLFIGYPEVKASETSTYGTNPSIVRVDLTELV